MKRHRRWWIGLAALILTSGAVALVLDRPKGAGEVWISVPLFVAGVILFSWILWPSARSTVASGPTLASRLIRRLTNHGKLAKVLPVTGTALVSADLAYNLFVSATPALLTEDIMVLSLGVALIGFPFFPQRYEKERDFVIVFFLVLNIILVLPLLILRAYFRDFDASVDAYSWAALAPETSTILSLIGVPNTVHSVPGLTAPGMSFTPRNVGIEVTLVITTSCSGIYSFGIFSSAFVAYVLSEYPRTSRRMWVLLGSGLLAAYAANILRMVVIVLVGYYTDTPATNLQNMLVAHSYAGWVIFLAWIALFWGLVFRFIARSAGEAEPSAPRKYGVLCGICGHALTPARLGYRCECGKFYHVACAATVAECPKCHRPMPAGTASFTPQGA